MSLSLVEEEAVDASIPHPAPRRRPLAAALGLTGALLVLLLSFAALVGGADDGPAPGPHFEPFSLLDAADEPVTLRHAPGRPMLVVLLSEPLDNLSSILGGVGKGLDVACVVQSRPAETTPAALGRPTGVLLDPAGAVASRYQQQELPALLVVSAEGRILDRGPLQETLLRLPQAFRGAE